MFCSSNWFTSSKIRFCSVSCWVYQGHVWCVGCVGVHGGVWDMWVCECGICGCGVCGVWMLLGWAAVPFLSTKRPFWNWDHSKGEKRENNLQVIYKHWHHTTWQHMTLHAHHLTSPDNIFPLKHPTISMSQRRYSVGYVWHAIATINPLGHG